MWILSCSWFLTCYAPSSTCIPQSFTTSKMEESFPASSCSVKAGRGRSDWSDGSFLLGSCTLSSQEVNVIVTYLWMSGELTSKYGLNMPKNINMVPAKQADWLRKTRWVWPQTQSNCGGLRWRRAETRNWLGGRANTETKQSPDKQNWVTPASRSCRSVR